MAPREGLTVRGKRDSQVESSLFHTSERLDSWKEIAAYLKRSVRTVHRWEKEETLPVHRHLHHRQGTVYAFMGELDAWRVSRRMHSAPRVQGEISDTGSEGIMLAVLPFQKFLLELWGENARD